MNDAFRQPINTSGRYRDILRDLASESSKTRFPTPVRTGSRSQALRTGLSLTHRPAGS